MSSETRIDLAQVRRRLAGTGGRHYWKSLDELSQTEGFREFLEREFPQNASEWSDPNGRREFLRIMGASMALAGLTACTKQPAETIVPYVRQPEEIVPGRPLFFATSLDDGGYAKGVLVESHMGRPTKIEGNALHPASLGGTDLFGQAAILSLYDPDRSKGLLNQGEATTWSALTAALKNVLDAQKAQRGAGLRLLTGAVTSPTLVAQIEKLLAELPQARWVQWDPVSRDASREGALLAFGEPVETRYHLDQADVLLALDHDFTAPGPANVREMHDYASRRKLQQGRAPNRLYVIESSPSPTGASADHKLPVKPSAVEGLARAIAAGLGLAVDGASKDHADWIGPMVKDLQKHAGACVVMAGETQPPVVHALAHAINARLGNVGRTVSYTAAVAARPADRPVVRQEAGGGGAALPADGRATLEALTSEMQAGQVAVLLVIGANPVYGAPADVPFAQALEKVAVRVHAGLFHDETGERCHWHVPLAHTLESWSDLRAFDGTVSLVQPLIAPLYDGKSVHELLAAFLGQAAKPGYDVVREYWKAQWGAEFETRWRRALHDGVVAGTAFAAKDVTPRLGDWALAKRGSAASGLELVFRPDPSLHDGRWANNGWLQELPKALTKLTWDNALLMSPRSAERLGIEVGSTARGQKTDVVELSYRGRKLEAPVWVVPGHPDEAVTLHLGSGRTRAGRVGNGVGVSAYALRTSDAPWWGDGVTLRKTGARYTLASTQDHWSMETEHQAELRHVIRTVEYEEYERDPEALRRELSGERPDAKMTLYPPEHKHAGNAWGMSIDLSSCVGCNACVVACQSENNIPVVGKEQVTMGREMHWIRVDRYYQGGLENPDTQHQPVLCMHCENAPCETVCPVAATSHNEEGLNDMVYNRCVGTRYCSNNCPYKVRRFNFFLYQDWETPSLKLMRNPDVTVRSRGVMEKCTYCVQRINHARIDARNGGETLKDGAIKTACEQACPTQAIVFGDINDAQSRVSRQKADARDYGLLEDLNTRPRTTYLAAVKNRNPEMPRG